MPKTSCSLTIDSEFVEWLDRKVKDRVYSSRSHGVDFVLSDFIKREKGEAADDQTEK